MAEKMKRTTKTCEPTSIIRISSTLIITLVIVDLLIE